MQSSLPPPRSISTYLYTLSNRPDGKWLVLFGQEKTRSARRKAAKRFQRPSDWIRMVALGVILADLAIFALVNILSNGMVGGYFAGSSAVFAGISACVFIIRISHPKLLYDWIFAAMAYIAVGVVLARSPSLSSTPAFACFISLFLVAAIARVWVGWTEPVGSSWFIAGGLTGVFCAAAILASRMMAIPLDADFVLVVDLIIQSGAVFGFAFSLRDGVT